MYADHASGLVYCCQIISMIVDRDIKPFPTYYS